MVTVTAMTAMEAMMVMMATLGQVRWRVQVKYYSAMFSTDNAASWSKPRPIEGADPGPRRHQFIQKGTLSVRDQRCAELPAGGLDLGVRAPWVADY
jgi:hypothetical protein